MPRAPSVAGRDPSTRPWDPAAEGQAEGDGPTGLGERGLLSHLPFAAGYYMFIETSRPRELGDRARLVSPLYNASAKFYCVSFFYHMYGKHIGESGAK